MVVVVVVGVVVWTGRVAAVWRVRTVRREGTAAAADGESALREDSAVAASLRHAAQR